MSDTSVGFIDKGGIQYRIDVEGNGQERLDAFRQSLLKTRRSFRAFRADIRALNTDARQVARGIDRLTTASEALEKQRARSATSARSQLRVSREQGRQAKQQTRAVRRQTDQERKLTKAQRERAALQAKLQRLTRSGPQIRELRVLQRRLQVTKQIIKAEQRLQAFRSLAAQGRDIRTGELFSEQQKRLLLESQNDLKREQATLDNAALRASRAELNATQAIVKAEQKLANEQALRAQGRLQTGLTPEETAFRTLGQQLDTLKLQETEKQLGKTNDKFRTMQQEVNATRKRLGQAQGRLRSFTDRLKKTGNQANRISFTFRRLIGIFAAFQALRLGAQLFTGAIKGGIEFNALMERAQLGIASLFTAVGEVRDPFGQVVNSSQQLAQAQKEARRQTQLLRRDSLETLATFEELVDTFQIAVAPGFTAGLNIDEIRRLSISISQAAAAIGLPQNQLAEEIRSLLAGTIQARTTRIATSLGITNEDIRRAKELGVLSEFLQQRFEAFGVAGKEALNTIDGLIARVRDSLSQLAGEGGIEFFQEIKGLLKDIIGLVQVRGNEGILKPNPEALSVINALLSGLTEAVRVARELSDALTLSEVLSVAKGLGNLIGVIANVLSTVFVGVTRGAATLGNLFDGLASKFSTLAKFFGSDSTREFLTTLIQIATVLLGIQLTTGIIGSLFGLLLSPVRLLVAPLILVSNLLARMGITLKTQLLAPLRAIRSVVLGIFSPLGLFVVALIAITVLIKTWVDDLAGVELKFTTFVKIIGTSLKGSFLIAIATIQLGFVKMFGFVRTGFRRVVIGVQTLALDFLDLLLRAAALFSDTAKDLRGDISGLQDRNRKEFKKQLEQDAQDLVAAEKRLREARDAVLAETGKDIQELVREDANADTILEALGLQKVIDGIKGIFGDADFSGIFDGANDGAQTLAERLDALPAIIGRGKKEVLDLSADIKKLNDEIRQAQGQLSIALGGAGLDGTVLAVRRELLQSEVDLREQSLKIEQERRSLSQQEIGLQTALNGELRKEKDLGITALVQKGVQLAKDRNALLREATTLSEQISAVEAAGITARKEGDAKRASALDSQLTQLIEQRKETEQSLKKQTDIIDSFPESAGDSEAQQALIDAITERISLEAQSLSNNSRLVSLTEQQLLLEEARDQLAATRIQTIATDDLQAAQDRFRLLQAEVATEQVLAENRGRFGNQSLQQELENSKAKLALEQTRFVIEGDALRRAQVAAGKNTAELERQVALAQARLDKTKELAAQQLASAQDVKQAEIAVQTASEARSSVIQAQTFELKAQELELQKQAISLDTLRQKTEEFKQDQIDSPISAGLSAGLEDFIIESENTFENFRSIASSAIRDISGALADEILNALDPNSNADFGERLNAVFQSIAKALLQQTIQQGIAGLLDGLLESGPNAAGNAQQQALLAQREALLAQEAANTTAQAAAFSTFSGGVTGLSTALPVFQSSSLVFTRANFALTRTSPILADSAGTLLSAAFQLQIAADKLLAANLAGTASSAAAAGGFQGGLLSPGPTPSAAHFNAKVRGLVAGGSPTGPRYRPPPGLDRRDTIPLWAAAGEFMQPVDSVRLYGTQVMEALRRRMIDPSALKALAGIGQRSQLKVAQPKAGFADGGTVVQSTGDRSFKQLDNDSGGEAGTAPLGVLIGEDEADLIFAQGTNALLELMSQEQSKFRSVLGV